MSQSSYDTCDLVPCLILPLVYPFLIRLKELLQLDPENSIARKALDDLEHDLAISAFQAMKVDKNHSNGQSA